MFRRHLLRECRIGTSTIQRLSGEFRVVIKLRVDLGGQLSVVKQFHRSIELIVGSFAVFSNVCVAPYVRRVSISSV